VVFLVARRDNEEGNDRGILGGVIDLLSWWWGPTSSRRWLLCRLIARESLTPSLAQFLPTAAMHSILAARKGGSVHVITVTRRTTAMPEAVWELWADVPNRTRWDHSLEDISVEGR
jgi:hypothetical protein